MDLLKELSQVSDNRIDELSADLHKLSLKIWNKPELKYEEIFAHGLLTETLKEHGFDVTPQYTMPTAFRATCESNKDGKGLTAGIICEYDALPEIGHACGHNLIAEAGIAAGLGKLKKIIRMVHEVAVNLDAPFFIIRFYLVYCQTVLLTKVIAH